MSPGRLGRVAVVGAGLAGLAAAWRLARAGVAVTVLERKGAAGGRAASSPDPGTGEPVDTGQHVFLGCYRSTLAWFSELGTRDLVGFQPRLKVVYRRPGGERRVFRAGRWPAPLHLLGGLRELGGMSLAQAWRMVREIGAEDANGALDSITVDAWLDRLGLPEEVRRYAILPLSLAALNEAPDRASAAPLAAVLRVLLAEDARGSAIGFSTVGLADTYVGAASKTVESAGGRVRTGAWARSLRTGADGRIAAVVLADGEEVEADSFVAALPPWDLAPLVRDAGSLVALADRAARFEPSPILSVHLWLDRTVHPDRFSGLEGGAFDWVFNRSLIVRGGERDRDHLCLVKSGARDLIGREAGDLADLAFASLVRCVPEAASASVIGSRIVWETRATVSLSPGTAALRPGPATGAPNLVVAGDWTDTGLPATIESAVRSGFTAADAVISSRA